MDKMSERRSYVCALRHTRVTCTLSLSSTGLPLCPMSQFKVQPVPLPSAHGTPHSHAVRTLAASASCAVKLAGIIHTRSVVETFASVLPEGTLTVCSL